MGVCVSPYLSSAFLSAVLILGRQFCMVGRWPSVTPGFNQPFQKLDRKGPLLQEFIKIPEISSDLPGPCLNQAERPWEGDDLRPGLHPGDILELEMELVPFDP